MLLELLNQINECSARDEIQNTEKLSHKHELISDIMGHINNNFGYELSLESISEKFFISPCYLSRIFKSTVKISLIDYINDVRIKEAKKLLSEGNLSIIEISHRVGYKSNTHFGRVFKKCTKMSPLKYRNLVSSRKQ